MSNYVIDESCDNCKFWRQEECRKTAPTIEEAIPDTARVQKDGTTYNRKIGIWPSTGSDKWCGEYERKIQDTGKPQAPPPEPTTYRVG